MTLTKGDIIEGVQTQIGLNKTKSTEIIEILLRNIKDTIASGEDIMISGFGKFFVKKKRGRPGRNPFTGDEVMIAPRRVVTFKCSGTFRKKTKPRVRL